MGEFFKTLNRNRAEHGLPRWLSGKKSACQVRDKSLISRLGDDPLEKEMATNSSILAWEIPQTEKTGGL